MAGKLEAADHDAKILLLQELKLAKAEQGCSAAKPTQDCIAAKPDDADIAPPTKKVKFNNRLQGTDAIIVATRAASGSSAAIPANRDIGFESNLASF